jgi:hypothetical protein
MPALCLAEVLANRSWLRASCPFLHIVARNVFQRDFYQAMAAQLKAMLDLGLSEVPDRKRISRTIPGYDAYGLGLSRAVPEPLALFLSPAWRDLMCNLFEIGPTPYVFAGIHYHAVDSKNGFIHNDLNPVWFPLAINGEIQTPNHEICSYKTGVGSAPVNEKIQVVRGAAMIFYLLNDGWRPGDGGETGLYASPRSPILDPDVRCAPENNSLVMFECTPHSFHTFLSNRRLPRASMIMWVHRRLEEAVEKFGRDRLEGWA